VNSVMQCGMLSECVLQYHPVGGAGGGRFCWRPLLKVSGSPRDSDAPDDRLQVLHLSTALS
jgi:hypothetical protein